MVGLLLAWVVVGLGSVIGVALLLYVAWAVALDWRNNREHPGCGDSTSTDVVTPYFFDASFDDGSCDGGDDGDGD